LVLGQSVKWIEWIALAGGALQQWNVSGFLHCVDDVLTMYHSRCMPRSMTQPG